MAAPVFMAAVRDARRHPAADRQRAQRDLPVPAAGDERGGLAAGGVRKIVLTASGGPFRSRRWPTSRAVTPEQACAHPNWVMGRKISVDSATMMNKGARGDRGALAVRRARRTRSRCSIHPQSVVHSLVEYVDGSVIAQLGNPDMRTPIAHALAYPERIDAGVAALDLARIGGAHFRSARLRALPVPRARLRGARARAAPRRRCSTPPTRSR